MNKHLLAATAAGLMFSAAACGGGSSSKAAPVGNTSSATAPAAGNTKIAFLMPCSACADRFENQDKPLFIAAVKAIDPSIEVIANNAQGQSATQVSQTESALTNGAKVVVVSPLDDAAGAAISAKATAAKVPLVSYDGLLTGAPVNFYVSFDLEKVGEAQGQYLAANLKSGAAVVMINGDQSIAPGRDFKRGAHTVLDPLFKSGKLKLAYESDTAQFSPEKGQASMEQALTKLGDKVDGVLVPNDGLAGAVINALVPRKLAGKVLVTGQDASDAGLQRIVLGQQSMTVYKALKAEAEAAAKAAVALAKGESVDALATTKVDNKAGMVPSVLLESVAVTKANLVSTVFADGFTTPAKVCTGDATGKCPTS